MLEDMALQTSISFVIYNRCIKSLASYLGIVIVYADIMCLRKYWCIIGPASCNVCYVYMFAGPTRCDLHKCLY